jgi:hypothetical protein
MKRIRILCLSTVLALAVIACVGGGSASASAFCGIELEVCPEEDTYAAETEVTANLAEGTEALFETSAGTVKCPQSNLQGKTLKEEGEPLTGEITVLKFEKCETKLSSCTLESIHLPFAASATYAAGEEKVGDGTLKVSNSGKGEPAVKVVCGLLKCIYAGELTLDVDGGEPGQIVAKKETVKLEKKEGLTECPAEGTFTGTYEIKTPENGAFVVKTVAQGTKLCKEEPPADGVGGARKCKTGQGYSGGIEFTLATGTEALFLTGATEIRCNKVKVTGNFKEDGTPSDTNGGIQTYTLNSEVGGVLGNCTSNFGGGTPRVEVTMQNVAYNGSNIVYIQAGAAQGALGMEGTNGPQKLRIVVTGGPTCVFRRATQYIPITNGTGAGKSLLKLSAGWVIEPGQPNDCPGTLGQATELKFERPSNGSLYVAKE